MMNKVLAVMKYHPEYCNKETKIGELMYVLKKYNYQEIYILNSEHRPIGIINKDDIHLEEMAKKIDPFDMSAEKLMTNITVVINKNSTLLECQKLMDKNQLDVLPVVDENGQYLGVVKKEDLLKGIASDLHYIY